MQFSTSSWERGRLTRMRRKASSGQTALTVTSEHRTIRNMASILPMGAATVDAEANDQLPALLAKSGVPWTTKPRTGRS